eukprot:TRINITY_DN4770_c0_g1_i1.p1 TRINITY_DN4770_c0_g1~~TRINITY_DN4770_c0_g1_i1.p1  ORF type:complete len:368 (+),score=50.67 TRINITY_DN4770_c0_g1_i1:168-1271(+)
MFFSKKKKYHYPLNNQVLMAAVPSWEPETVEKESKGSYRCGVVVGGTGEVSGEASLQLKDFNLNPGKRFRGGKDVLSVSTEMGRWTQRGDLTWQRPLRNGQLGVSVTHKQHPARQAQPGWPSWHSQHRRSTEGRLSWMRNSVVREIFCRVKKWDGEVDGSELPVAAVGAKLLFGDRNTRLSALLEGGITTPFARLELDGLLRRGDPRFASTELRANVRNLNMLLEPFSPEPPAGELYNFGGAEVRGFTQTGLLPSAAGDMRNTLPATSTASFSVTRLAPIDSSIGLLIFLDGGAAAGRGHVSPSNTLPLLDSPKHASWATPLFLSYGVGLYIPSAPNLRAGIAWGLDKRLQARKTTQRFFLSAVGEL